jgi:hypothetical protein
MGTTDTFLGYAQDFEKTYADDDWSRLERYFAPDAVYEVRNVPFGCRLVGPQAIFRGIKKSLDGFDRRMDERTVAVVDGPYVEGERVSLGWTVTYAKRGAPDFVLRGRSSAQVVGGKIVELTDEYPDGMAAEAGAWFAKHAPDADPSYT